ncbi:predicted secreted protein [Rhizobium subbaraonis]|uniref:Predicted secreted protein n=1 Tax=Rhizobium subbaraonis TaxID=908946 RepID=A0A285UAY2_9HYPH|nr:phage tail tube protein [Rhizobium subbaraonis]SOC38982.1 predicted secreted protein [Rhizobium subbaraonis]
MALGRTLTLARSDGAGGFDLVCITEQRSLEINNEEIDITKPACLDPGSKLVLALMYGIQSVRFNGQGAFVSSATMKKVTADVVNQVVQTYQVSVPGVGTFEGDMLVSMTFSGDKTNELQSDIRCAMSGVLTFVAEA